ncbi:MAG: DUF447 domain-containing protein [Halobellus sp.]|uniref:DUF447 domain-containing protein n=1 Tax=Halobellus sp. TaxID=1979212 RepID=UPI0035D44B78
MNSGTWPADLRGVVESVTSTRGPDGQWHVAALGLQAGEQHADTDAVHARTWGQTRTRQNFERRESARVQFVRDPVVFVKAALGELETDGPVLDAADAWVEVDVTAVETGTSGGTEWVDWRLSPVRADIERRVVPVTTRSLGAVIELAVAASRLGVPSYDDDELRDRMTYFADVATNCGASRTREAVGLVASLSAWTPDDEVAAEIDVSAAESNSATDGGW